ncbi:MAG: hypothetical protein V3V49_01370 [Candidatus Krumholzibacteria bacterium]
MGKTIQRIVTRAFILGAPVAFLGCGSTPRVCTVSPIAIEETKSDTRDLETELSEAVEKRAKARADLAAWQERLTARQAEPPVLRAELERLKKASGRLEPKPEEESPQVDSQAQQIKLQPQSQREDG